MAGTGAGIAQSVVCWAVCPWYRGQYSSVGSVLGCLSMVQGPEQLSRQCVGLSVNGTGAGIAQWVVCWAVCPWYRGQNSSVGSVLGCLSIVQGPE